MGGQQRPPFQRKHFGHGRYRCDHPYSRLPQLLHGFCYSRGISEDPSELLSGNTDCRQTDEEVDRRV